MTEEEANVALLRKAYQAWHETKGNPSGWYAILADDVQWRSLANGRPGMEFTRPCTSKEEVKGYFDGLLRGWTMEFYRIDEYIAQGDRVVALGATAWINNATGKRSEIQKVDVWRIRNNLVVEHMEHYDTYAALTACEP